jgi:predicted nucleotidyltransferase
MKEQIKLIIIDTLAYFDVFNYPLTLDQIYLFLHYNHIQKKLIKECLGEMPIVENKNGLYFFSGKQEIAIKRKLRKKDNYKKVITAVSYSNLLSMIPGVKMVSLTGSVAMQNASADDDIDLFIITRKNMLWTTRLIAVCITKILGIKRERRSRKNKNKMCLNMFLDERDMELSEKNLYTAHEIVQMKILYDEHKVFEDFMNKNLWIRDFFPKLYVKKRNNRRSKKWFEPLFFSERILGIINFSAFILQYVYMSSRITKEQVSLTKAFFHPNNSNKFILTEYKKRKEIYSCRNELSENLDKIKKDEDLTKKAGLVN